MVLLKHSGLKFLSDEVMSAVDENPEEAMLRKFFQGILELLLNDSPNILMINLLCCCFVTFSKAAWWCQTK